MCAVLKALPGAHTERATNWAKPINPPSSSIPFPGCPSLNLGLHTWPGTSPAAASPGAAQLLQQLGWGTHLPHKYDNHFLQGWLLIIQLFNIKPFWKIPRFRTSVHCQTIHHGSLRLVGAPWQSCSMPKSTVVT